MAKIKVLKLCATKTQTYFGGEILEIPGQVDAKLAEAWIESKIAEKVKEAKPSQEVEEAKTPEENSEVEEAKTPEAKPVKTKAK